MRFSRRDRGAAGALALLLFLVFNANGREIGTYDSQPTKFAARELLLRGTLSLNHVVGQAPGLGTRPGFQVARDGHYRSAYSPVPSIAAAAVVWPLVTLGIVDVRAPLAHNLISKLASSLLISLAVSIGFLTARLYLSLGRAFAVAAGAGLGTGLWSTASQTLWQHETSVLGLAAAVFVLCRLDVRGKQTVPGNSLHPSRLTGRGTGPLRGLSPYLAIGLGLGLAAGSRLQLAPAVGALLVGVVLRAGWVPGVVAGLGTATIVVPVLVANVHWFGSPLGAAPLLEGLHASVHATTGSFSLASGGFAGLLVSPNRGLFVFSPIVLVALLGLPRVLRSDARGPLAWCTIAAVVQFTLYASYVVWWAGHTYGPRYMLDVLPLLLPLAVAGAERLRGVVSTTLAAGAFAWSVGVAGIGAFCHPEGRWNNVPLDVDRHHARLWDWRDTQIRRTWAAGRSPQNQSLLTRDAFRAGTPHP